MKQILILAMVLGLLSGCASVSQSIIDKQIWDKENINQEQYQKDKYQCEHESYMEASHIATSGRNGLIPLAMAIERRVSRFGSCMKAKGYNQK